MDKFIVKKKNLMHAEGVWQVPDETCVVGIKDYESLKTRAIIMAKAIFNHGETIDFCIICREPHSSGHHPDCPILYHVLEAKPFKDNRSK